MHYLRYGEAEGRKPNPHFDVSFYLTTNADIAATGISPLAHYVLFGARERRSPNPLFDISCYLSRNPDVAASGARAPGALSLAGSDRRAKSEHSRGLRAVHASHILVIHDGLNCIPLNFEMADVQNGTEGIFNKPWISTIRGCTSKPR